MSYEKTTWAAGDKVTSAKLNNIETGIESTDASLTQLNEVVSGLSTSVNNAASADTVSELSNTVNTNTTNIDTNTTAITKLNDDYTALNDQVQQNVDVINDNALILDGTVSDVNLLLSKVYMLESKIEDMRKTNVVAKAVALNEFPETQSDNIMDNILTLNQTDEDVALTTSEPISGKVLVVNAKSVTAKNMEMDSAKFTSKCSGDIVIDNFTSTGTLVKTNNGNTKKAFDLVSGEYVTIKNCTFGMTSYNTIEIGLGGTNPDPKGVLIDNCVFEKNSNNSILVFGATDNAQITVSNCHFKACSNALRYSNKNNSKNVTINFINCKFDELEARENMQMWKAVFIAENYTSQAATWVEDNLFAPEKVTVNFVNCTYEGQPIVAQENQADYWNLGGTPEAGKQYLGTMCYDLFSHESLDANGIPLEYHADRLPIINVK